MKKYKCKKSFYVDKYDNDGFLIENDGVVIEEGKIYELNESEYMMIGFVMWLGHCVVKYLCK
ncbi:putative uncharacterized protein [Lachnospiraceae bacterium CAG:364]|nr:putative uncharacterized protein [Lachnospiraceae bacterium CAG:364]